MSAATTEARDVSAEVVVRLAADPDEFERACRLRYEVYVEELGVYGREADHDRRLLAEELDEDSDVLVAIVDDEVVGTARVTVGSRRRFPEWAHEDFQLHRFDGVVPEDRMGLLTRLIVAPGARGTVVPMHLMAAEVQVLVDSDVDLVFTDCEPHLLALYTTLGFRPYCGTITDENGDLSVPLVCLARDRDHLEALSSPLLGWGGDEVDPDGGAATTEEILARCDLRPPVRSVEPDLPAHLVAMAGIFEGLEVAEAGELVTRSRIIDLEAGRPLLRAGQRRRNVYVVVEGSLRIDARDGLVGPGEVVGEVALLTGEPRTVQVEAGPAGARLLTLSPRTLDGLMASRSRVAAVLLHNLARTLAWRLVAAAGER